MKKFETKSERKSVSKKPTPKTAADETALRMVWVAEAVICVLVSVSAFITAMVY